MALTPAERQKRWREAHPEKVPPAPPRRLSSHIADKAITFRRASNLMGQTMKEAFARGLTTPEAIRDEGLQVLRELARSSIDERIRAMAANSMAAIGSAESRAMQKGARGGHDEAVLESLTDAEVVDLQELIAQVRAKRANEAAE